MANDITTGAYDDIKRATKIARAMVSVYGMSSLGPIQYEDQNHSVFLGRDYMSEKTRYAGAYQRYAKSNEACY